MDRYKYGYDFLEEFCKIKSYSSFHPTEAAITPRVQFIMDRLNEMEIPYSTDIFPSRKFNMNYGVDSEGKKLPDEKNNYINVYVPFKSKKEDAKTIVILAHHDIANENSENCQDNSASVCNLLHLCKILKNSEFEENITVVFTDAEEIVDFNGSGSAILSYRIKNGHPDFLNFQYAINLELTGKGNIVWADLLNSYGRNKMQPNSKLGSEIVTNFSDVKPVTTPFSDSAVLRHHGLDSVCIGIITEEDFEQLKTQRYCDTWAMCHQEADTIEKISRENMNSFVQDILLPLVKVKTESVISETHTSPSAE